MADRKEWKEQLLSKLLDQYEKSVTYAGENKVKQVFSVKPSDIFKGYNKDFLPPEQLFQEKEFERLIRQMESEGLIHVVLRILVFSVRSVLSRNVGKITMPA